jgi:hypothetical protein
VFDPDCGHSGLCRCGKNEFPQRVGENLGAKRIEFGSHIGQSLRGTYQLVQFSQGLLNRWQDVLQQP